MRLKSLGLGGVSARTSFQPPDPRQPQLRPREIEEEHFPSHSSEDVIAPGHVPFVWYALKQLGDITPAGLKPSGASYQCISKPYLKRAHNFRDQKMQTLLRSSEVSYPEGSYE